MGTLTSTNSLDSDICHLKTNNKAIHPPRDLEEGDKGTPGDKESMPTTYPPQRQHLSLNMKELAGPVNPRSTGLCSPVLPLQASSGSVVVIVLLLLFTCVLASRTQVLVLMPRTALLTEPAPQL